MTSVSIGPKLSAEIDHDATDLSESESLVTSPETLLYVPCLK